MKGPIVWFYRLFSYTVSSLILTLLAPLCTAIVIPKSYRRAAVAKKEPVNPSEFRGQN